MISIKINVSKFEYDIHSLFKAFFTSEDVLVSAEAENPDYVITFEEDSISLAKGNEAGQKVCFSEDISIPDEKNELKRLIYRTLSKELSRELVWGDLTGIRPTKIPMKLMEEGKSDEEIAEYMKRTYLVSDDKTNLSIEIAHRERAVLAPLDYENGYSLYIGIPFCPTTCLYCSFTSNAYGLWQGKVSNYLEALFREIEYVSSAHKGQKVDTIYIGGGTPTSLNADELRRLMDCVNRNFDTTKLLEFTVEAGRPDSITVEKLKVLKEANVTRISVNPQTMNQKTLDLIGRRHKVEDVERAFTDARCAGFDNINMDIILGLPGEDVSEVSNTLSKISEMKPDSLTVHSLAIKRGSRLWEHISEYGYDTMINTPTTMKMAEDAARSMNLNPYYLYRQKNMAGNYENTGYAREGAYGIYNILIMEEVQSIVACGAGTVTKRVFPDGRIERCDDVKDVALYISKIDEMIDRKRKLFA